jgi:hypothetical protein
MKDALGHGSNAHNSGIAQLPRDVGYRVEKRVAFGARTAAGQRVTTTGAIWQKASGPKRRAVAENIAKGLRVDNPNNTIRIR